MPLVMAIPANQSGEYLEGSNPVYRTAGVLLFDPTATFAVGMQHQSSSQRYQLYLAKILGFAHRPVFSV